MLPFALRVANGNANSRPDGVRTLPVVITSLANFLCHAPMPEYLDVNC